MLSPTPPVRSSRKSRDGSRDPVQTLLPQPGSYRVSIALQNCPCPRVRAVLADTPRSVGRTARVAVYPLSSPPALSALTLWSAAAFGGSVGAQEARGWPVRAPEPQAKPV